MGRRAGFTTLNITIKKTKRKKDIKEHQQGCAVSPTLFRIYTSKLLLTQKNINVTSYADDVTLTTLNHRMKHYGLDNSITNYFTRYWLEGGQVSPFK